MQGTFVAPGLAIDYTPGADVVGGDVVVQQNIVGIAKRDIVSGELGALAVSGVFDIVKKQEAFATVGANIFWDTTGDPYLGSGGTGAATATSGGNTWMGVVLEAAEANDTTVRVLLRMSVSLVAEAFAMADLSDMGASVYTAGMLIVADGAAYAEVALTGPFNLSAAGLLSLDSATVAALGNSQGTAAAIADGFTLVSAADGTKGVKLPTAAAGGLCIVKNNGAAVLKVYPFTGDAIDAEAGNAAISLPAYAERVFVAYDVTTWYSSTIATGELTRAQMLEEALKVYGIPLQDLRNDDGSVLDATGGGGLFSATSGGMGTGTLTIDGEAASGNTKTDILQFEFVLPPEYVAAGDVKLVLTAQESVGAATTSTTLSAEVYESDGEGAVGADLYNAFDITDITASWQTCTAVVTAAGLVAGDRLIAFVKIVTNDGGGAVGTIAQIGKIELQLDIKG